MKIVVENSTRNFESYRAQRVKSLFNAEDGSSFKTEANIDIDDLDWLDRLSPKFVAPASWPIFH